MSNDNKLVTQEIALISRVRIFIKIIAMVAAVVVLGICVISDLNKKETVVDHQDKVTEVVKDYSEIYSIVKRVHSNQNKNKYDTGAGVLENSQTTAGANSTMKPNSNSTNNAQDSEQDFSNTNIQVDGVQEADKVKTDGKYIYALYKNIVNIVSVGEKPMDIVSKIKTQDSGSYLNQEIYVYNDTLTILTQRGNNKTHIRLYNITDRSSPKLIKQMWQDGRIVSSRMVGNLLYTVTNHTIANKPNEKLPETFVPQVSTENGCNSILPNDICVLPQIDSATYTVVTALDVRNPEDFISSKAILGNSCGIYSSLNNLYVASVTYDSNTKSNDTEVVKFSYNDGNIKLCNSAKVKGRILNQFSMDEYQGCFRIVTTQYQMQKSSNSLYILNNELETIGKIEDLAKNERVYSVRFDNEIAYFVTFRQVDPLFTVDISDPTNPKVLSELKIPGFSEYLHMFKSGRLFGLGCDADENSGKRGNLKLSMFDVSNKANVKETNKLIIQGAFHSEALTNHKAILISEGKNIISFPTEKYYLIYSYDDKDGFKESGRIKLNQEYSDGVRGLYINEVLYVIENSGIRAFNTKGFDLIHSVSFE